MENNAEKCHIRDTSLGIKSKAKEVKGFMGKLYDARMKIEKAIQDKKLDAVKVKGEIGLKAGIMLAFVKENSPDDDAKLASLKKAAMEVLNLSI